MNVMIHFYKQMNVGLNSKATTCTAYIKDQIQDSQNFQAILYAYRSISTRKNSNRKILFVLQLTEQL
ncbi:MAG: hypothetical protein CL912_22915 [Deltaproteobacteria bacterium]|nr:hypothetical protein [Deltaproteobacteria bacterium]